MSLALLLEGSLPLAPPGKSLKQEALTQIYKYVLDNPILIFWFLLRQVKGSISHMLLKQQEECDGS